MTGHVVKKRGHWYVVIEFGYQPARRCAGCGRLTWTWETGELGCSRCASTLEEAVERRRQKWHGSWGRRSEAKAALTDLLSRSHAGTYVAPRRTTLAEFVERQWIPALQVRPSTAFSYTRNLRIHVLPTLGSVQIQELAPAHLNALYRQLLTNGNRGHRSGQGLSPRTVRYLHTTIHRVLGDAVKWNVLSRNVADSADPPRLKDAEDAAPEMVTWTAQQLSTFLAWVADSDYGPAFAFAARTGMRRGEVLGLRWSDVKLDATPPTAEIKHTRITVAHRAQEGRLKTGKGASRKINLGVGAAAALRQQRARQAQHRLLLGTGYPSSDFVFCRPDGQPYHPDRFSRQFDRTLERRSRLHPDSTLPRLRLHDLRHTWATLALEAGIHPKVVAEQLGHSSVMTTLRVYSHVRETMAHEAAERVTAIIGDDTSS